MEVWKIIFLSKWVICRFHVNLPGCIPQYLLGNILNLPTPRFRMRASHKMSRYGLVRTVFFLTVTPIILVDPYNYPLQIFIIFSSHPF